MVAGDLRSRSGFVSGTRLRDLHQYAGLLLRLHGARFGGSRDGQGLWPGLSAGFDPRQCAGAGASCWIRWACGGCGWCWAAPLAACRRWIGPSTIPSAWSGRLIIGVTPLSAMGLALNHLQRQAIQHDPEWAGGHYLPQRPPRRGLALARQIAMLSYKSAALFNERFGAQPQPQRRGSMGAGRPGRRPHRRTLRHCRLPGPTRASGSSTASTPMPIWPFCAPWTPGTRCAAIPRPQRPSAASAPGSALWASARTGCFLPRGARICLYHSRRRGAGRLPGDDQRPRPRRLPGRTGRTGAAAAIRRGVAWRSAEEEVSLLRFLRRNAQEGPAIRSNLGRALARGPFFIPFAAKPAPMDRCWNNPACCPARGL